MNKKIFKNNGYMSTIMIATVIFTGLLTNQVSAANIPNLAITNGTSSVKIDITGADQNATVMFNYPNIYSTNQTTTSYTSIDIGHTDSNGSFSVAVAPNSYGLSGGVSVYVSVDGASSSKISWPATSSASSQAGALSLSKQKVNLVQGQSVNVFADNTANALVVAGNSNPNIVSTSIKTDSNSVLLTGLNIGISTVSICASSVGCGTVNVSVQSPTQKVTFNQSQAYVVVGQPTQTIGIYGPGSYNSLTNTNKDIVSASVDGTNLVLHGLAVGQSTVSVCATGYLCGSIVVNSLSSGSAIPTQNTVLAPVSSGFNQPPQLSSISMSSNNVLGLFFGTGSTISINFGTNETVTNVIVKIGGYQTAANQGTDGLYYATYKATGNDELPLPVVISFTNLKGVVGQYYLWMGNSSKSPAGATASVATSGSSSSSGAFTRYLYSGMTDVGSSDSEVAALQQRLKSDSVYAGPITGYFGPQTKQGVQAYQKKHGLDAIGVVGPSTRELLNKGV
jgi:hypothetical protein